jgi:hypothetical protein
MTNNHDDEIRARLRAAADEVAQRYPARGLGARVGATPLRRVLFATQLAVFMAAVVFIAAQNQGVGPSRGLGAPVPQTSPTPAGKSTDERFMPEPLPSPVRESAKPTPSETPSPFTKTETDRDSCRYWTETEPPEGISVDLEVTPTSSGATLKLTMRNNRATPFPNAHGSQEVDFIVTGPEGDVWRWSTGKAFTAILVKEAYDPGQERTKTERWDGTVNCPGADVAPGPGTYTAIGLWETWDDEKRVGSAWRSNVVRFTLG